MMISFARLEQNKINQSKPSQVTHESSVPPRNHLSLILFLCCVHALTEPSCCTSMFTCASAAFPPPGLYIMLFSSANCLDLLGKFHSPVLHSLRK